MADLNRLSIEILFSSGALGFDMKSPDDDPWLDIDDNYICRMSEINDLIDALKSAKTKFDTHRSPKPNNE